jgi:TRAP-type mannitol/chloroaromatic compound transport system permease large subunit
MDEVTLGLASLIFILVFFLTGIELAFGIAITGLIGYSLLSGFEAGYSLYCQDLFDTFSTYSLTVIPLFMLMGQITFQSGIAQRLYDVAHKLIGRMTGSLAMAMLLRLPCLRLCVGPAAQL